MNLNSEYSILYFIFSSAIAIVISFYFYKKVKMPAASKILLIFLRFSGIQLILLLIFVSFYSVNKKSTEKPLNIFLIDYSGSISIDGRTDETIKAIERVRLLENEQAENRYYTFSRNIIKETDGNRIPDTNNKGSERDATNLSKTIESISKLYGNRKISSINIVTDGIINEGGNPLQALQQTNAVLNYYLTGDTIQKNDLSVRNVYFNKISYSGSNTQIRAEINSYNYEKTIRINLYEDENLILNEELAVNREKNLYYVNFDVKSGTEGIKKYRIEITGEPGEITDKNNAEEFFIEYLNNKFKLLVISGNPGPDFSYLREAISGSENFDADFLTQKSAGVFYEGQIPPLDEYNVLMLINFPTAVTDLNLLEKLNSELGKVNLPVFFISGSSTDYERLKAIGNFLPFTILNSKGQEEKSAVKLLEDISPEKLKRFSFEKSLGNIPEIFIPGITTTPKSGVQTILYSGRLSKPVLLYSESEKNNSAAFLGYGFYKWRLNNSGNNSRDILGSIIKNIVLSISSKEKNKKITLDIEKQQFSPFEEIKLNGSINLSNTSGNETIKIQIYNNNTKEELQVSKSSVNSFYAGVRGIPEGEYFVKCSLFENGTETANDIKKILVKESNLEFRETRTDKTLMDELSVKTGGDRIRDDNIKEISEKIYERNRKDRTIITTDNKIFLNSSIFLLFLIIAVFSAEWFIRKRSNLP